MTSLYKVGERYFLDFDKSEEYRYILSNINKSHAFKAVIRLKRMTPRVDITLVTHHLYCLGGLHWVKHTLLYKEQIEELARVWNEWDGTEGGILEQHKSMLMDHLYIDWSPCVAQHLRTSDDVDFTVTL